MKNGCENGKPNDVYIQSLLHLHDYIELRSANILSISRKTQKQSHAKSRWFFFFRFVWINSFKRFIRKYDGQEM